MSVPRPYITSACVSPFQVEVTLSYEEEGDAERCHLRCDGSPGKSFMVMIHFVIAKNWS